MVSKKTPEPSPPKVVSPEITSSKSISSPVDRFAATTLEDATLISTSAKRSGAPSPSPSSRGTNVVVPNVVAQHPFHAPETPNIDYKNTADLPSEQQAPVSSATPAAPADLTTPAALTIKKVTEVASEISNANPNEVANIATHPQIVQHEEDEKVMEKTIKKKKKSNEALCARHFIKSVKLFVKVFFYHKVAT